MHGATTSVVMVDFEEAKSTWSQYDFFDNIRDIVEWGLYFTFVFLMWSRLRRLVPQSVSVKAV